MFGWLSRTSRDFEWSQRVEALEARMRALEKVQSEIEVEWNGWFDKFRRLYARLAKRVSDANKEVVEDSEGAGNAAPGLTRNPLAQQLLRGGPIMTRDGRGM